MPIETRLARDNRVLVFVFATLFSGWLLSWYWQLPLFIESEIVLRGVTLCLTIAIAGAVTVLIYLLPGRFLRLSVLAILVLLASVAITLQFVHIAMFGALLNISAVNALLSTSGGESAEFLRLLPVTTTLPILIYWLLLAAGLVGIARTCTLAKARLQIGAIALVLLTLTPAIALAAYSSFGKFAQWVAFPSALKEIVGNDLMVRSSLLYGRYKAERQEFESLLSQRSEISPQIDNVPEEPLTVVLVLGESASRGNHGVYGYPLDTTPHMSKMKSELLLMNSAVSPATMTLDSVVRMLTHASNKNKEAWVESSSVINVAAAAGYQTWWLSNQGQLGQHDTDVTVLAKESARFQSINTSMVNSSDDMKLLPMFDEILSGEDRKQFVIMHIMGSHYDYSKRFPVEEAVLTTDDYPKGLGLDNFSQSALQRLADYDNSIRYTDQFLARTIALLEASGRNSVMVYLSDHGEELTADIKIYGHGNPLIKPVHVDVPFLVWLSEQWQQRNKDSFVVDGDREVVEGRVFSTEDLFHTLLSLLNISSDEYDATVDVLSPVYRSQEILIYTPLGDYVDYSDI